MSNRTTPTGMNIFMVMEAVASVSLSHDDGCRCLTCRAALGDERALGQIMAGLAEMEEQS